MKMKIKILSNRALQTLKKNIKVDMKKYSESNGNSLIETLEKDAFVDIGLEYEKFSLNISNDPQTDFENVKSVYGALKDVISPSMASDERLWAGLAFSDDCWKYINARWRKDGWSSNTIYERFYYKQKGRRALTRNALARLWWIGYLTYDETGKTDEEKWKYTKFVCSNQRYIVDMLERNASNNKELIKACINECEKYEKDNPGKKVDSNKMREIQKYMSILGGTYLIDSLPIDILQMKIGSRIAKI